MHTSRKVRFTAAIGLSAAMLFVVLLPAAGVGATEGEVTEFIAKIQDDNADVRYAAWRDAGKIGARAVVPLGDLVASKSRGVARAASEALNTIAHHASRPKATAERKAVTRQLLRLLGRKKQHATRVKALELLALTGADKCVPRIARLLNDDKLREDARRALERIPGKASLQALIEASKTVPEEFRPAVIHSLGQEGAMEALDALVDCAESPNKAVALAAFEAMSRIGEVHSRDPQPVLDWETLSERDRIFIGNAFLRFAEKRAAKGDKEMALEIYRGVLARSEQEHFKCAGLIGMGKFGSASDVEPIVMALSAESAIVRSVASEALTALRGPTVNAALEKAMEMASPDVKDSISKILAARKSK